MTSAIAFALNPISALISTLSPGTGVGINIGGGENFNFASKNVILGLLLKML